MGRFEIQIMKKVIFLQNEFFLIKIKIVRFSKNGAANADSTEKSLLAYGVVIVVSVGDGYNLDTDTPKTSDLFEYPVFITIRDVI